MANLAVPIMRTFNVGEFETGAYFNSNVRDADSFLLNVPACNAVQATGQNITSGLSWTSLSLDSTVFDSYGGHSTSVNNSRYTAQVAGWYLVFGAACYPSNATGWRGARVAKNGAAIAGGAAEIGANTSGVTAISSPPVIVFLQAGDYVESQGLQNSGSTLTTSTNSDADSSLTAVWLHT